MEGLAGGVAAVEAGLVGVCGGVTWEVGPWVGWVGG